MAGIEVTNLTQLMVQSLISKACFTREHIYPERKYNELADTMSRASVSMHSGLDMEENIAVYACIKTDPTHILYLLLVV